MRKIKVSLSLMLLALFLFTPLLLVAAGQTDAEAKPVTIKFTSTAKWKGVTGKEPDGQDGDWEKYHAKKFMEENPNINVEVEIWPAASGGFDPKFNLAITSNTLSDVLHIGPSNVMTLVYLDLAVPIDDYVQNKDDLYPGLWKSAEWKGAHYFLPHQLNVQGFAYNKDIFDAAGTGVPTNELRYWTDEEYFAALQKVKTVYPDKYGVNIHAKADSSDFGWRCWFWGFGARMFSADGRKITFNSPESLATLNYLAKLYDAGVTNPAPPATSDVDVWKALFYTQKGLSLPFVMVWYGRYLASVEKGENDFFNVHVAMQPGPKKTANALIQTMCMPKSPNSDDMAVRAAAGKFFNYLNSGERAAAAKIRAQLSGRPSINETLYADSTDDQILFAPKLLPYVVPDDGNYVPGFRRLRTEWNQVIQKFWNKELSPQQTLDEIDRKIQPLLDDEWSKIK